MFSCLRIDKKAKEETRFLNNGSMLLENLIISCNGKYNHIRTFSSEELSKATNNYQHEQMIFRDSGYTLYKGIIQDLPVTVKRYYDDGRESLYLLESAITDIVIGTQMSVHKNVLKLIGCCLESQFPILVYEYVGNTTPSNLIGSSLNPLSWKCRVKVAAEIAYAVSYLHIALSRPVVLLDIRPSTIMLDHQDNAAKLTDFSLSVPIPDGESHIITSVRAKTGSLPPEYVISGYVSEKLDVFCFGVLMLQLLAGDSNLSRVYDSDYVSPDKYLKQCIGNGKLIDIVDPAISKEVEQPQVGDFGKVALSCMCDKAEDRPTMIDVTKQLNRIHQSL